MIAMETFVDKPLISDDGCICSWFEKNLGQKTFTIP